MQFFSYRMCFDVNRRYVVPRAYFKTPTKIYQKKYPKTPHVYLEIAMSSLISI
jgi:hypothetical protein